MIRIYKLDAVSVHVDPEANQDELINTLTALQACEEWLAWAAQTAIEQDTGGVEYLVSAWNSYRCVSAAVGRLLSGEQLA